MKKTNVAFLLLILCQTINAQTYTVDGELKKWHKITITFDGPSSSEDATPNPFADYKFDVLFTNGSKSYNVAGYFAADGDAAETSATAGNKWMAHFTPDTIGTWSFTTTFYEGTDIAINNQSGTEGILHNISGNFNIAATDKSGKDFRGRGRLSYVSEHYLRFEEDSTWFFKAGADAPENTLAYEDFDDVPNRGNRRKSWQPHLQDYDSADASDYTWQNGKGTELLGVLNYLSNKGVNAFSFLTLSLHGDDENVFPYLLKVPVSTYNGYNDADQWNLGVHHDRFDVSRMAQWERIFEYADKKGLYMHFKTLETENDNIMDNNGFGRERKLYYRELIARFGHHLALNWNMAEESTLTDAVAIATSNYIADMDPYDHNIVLHTYPGQQSQRYNPLLGNNSSLTGASIQIGKSATHDEIVEWVEESNQAGKKWVVANDEQGSANIGVDADPNDNQLVRNEVLWGTLMGGGAGVEYYYGYQTNGTDLDAEDHRTRDLKYTDAAIAIDFFDTHLQEYIPMVFNDDDLTDDNSDYVLTNGLNMVTVYLPEGGSTDITLDQNSDWITNWFNPRTGVMSYTNTVTTTSITAPDNDDWVALITSECPPEGTACDDGDNTTTNDTLTVDCVCIGEPCPVQGTLCDDGDSTTVDDQEDGSCNCLGIESRPIPGKVEAENFFINFGTNIEPCTDVGGGNNLGNINHGDSTVYKIKIDSTGDYNIIFRVASNSLGGDIIFTLDGVLDTATVINTGGWQTWTDVVLQATFPDQGIYDLKINFAGGSDSLLNLNYINFTLANCTIGAACDDNDPDTANDKYDLNCACTGTPILYQSPLLEAEDATYGSEWTVMTDADACRSEYLLPPNSTSYDSAPETAADLVSFTFSLDVAGTYKVYARTLTTNDGDDSFWVRANNGTWQKWNKINAPDYPSGYQWSQVGNWTSGDNPTPVTFELNQGANTVDFAWREPNARLDKVFVTNEDLSKLNLVRVNSTNEEYSFQYIVNEACPNDTVRFDPITDGSPIVLTSQLITIDKPLFISGNGMNVTFLDGSDQNQFFINNANELTIEELKFLDGYSETSGGAFLNNGIINLKNIIFEGNYEGMNPLPFTNSGTIKIAENGVIEIKE
ncbi:MAG: carbohydrate-binding protein [Bacteroidota bacterium]